MALQRKIEAFFFNLLKISYLWAVLDLRRCAGFTLGKWGLFCSCGGQASYYTGFSAMRKKREGGGRG